MSQVSGLLPTRQAHDLREALLDYLRTTFALADAEAQTALQEFLTDPADGIFRGPYVRMRLPFRPADDGWDRLLDWLPDGFTPYGHQAAAFARLASRAVDGTPRRPYPTLVTTGTGSGKTEGFLYPILDHVLRAKRAGTTGTKALILYPMNALANDQAGRLAGLITGDRRLAGVTAALYTGESGAKRTRVSTDGLINDRAIIRDTAPDILLTNYKMLDQLLLRSEDQPLWQQSADSLTYLVLDEFHTYDGAQGTDVAMLLRRLAIALQGFRTTPASGTGVGPLCPITPVATSATLGDGGDPSAMIDFATTVFGEPFGTDAVITESRLSLDEWAGPAEPDRGAAEITIDPDDARYRDADGGHRLTVDLAAQLTGRAAEEIRRLSLDELGAIYRADPRIRALIAGGAHAHTLPDCATTLFGTATPDDQRLTTALISALSRLRAGIGRQFVTVETHLWVRELSRIDRAADPLPRFRWSDDGPAAIEEATADSREAFPAVYCRHCGRSGWGIELAPVGSNLGPLDPFAIRRRHAAKEGRFRALLHAPGEAIVDDDIEGLSWLDLDQHVLTTQRPAEDDDALLAGRILPVLSLIHDPDTESHKDTCPSCNRPDGIRFLGSAIATLLSVSLSALFGSRQIPSAEKKALIFTDSVQDAAHRAGFVESRSHTLTMRSAIRRGLDDEPAGLDVITDRILTDAGTDPFARYRLLPPELIGRQEFDAFWEQPDRLPPRTRQRIHRRLLFDVIGEFGVHSRVGRTLEATGTAWAEVDLGLPVRLLNTARAVLDRGEERLPLPDRPSDDALIAWVRGVVEHLRTQGAIEHEWLSKYIDEDGNRYRIWGGRARDQGMPAFPTGRTAPAFPRVGPKVQRKADVLLDAVTTTQSWYARWSGRVLALEPGHAARLARALLARLHDDGVLTTRTTGTGGTAYALPPGIVTAALITDERLAAGDHVLRCGVCRTEQPGGAVTVAQLDGAPCLLARCTGTLRREPRRDNYYRRLYRSTDIRRIVAREHTGLLDDETRLLYENGFKAAVDDASAPNVLVATPTLEMGIDIGDLSAVVLASLPRTVASYLQRVGRAGRLTGNALDLAFATGRGESLHRLGDPLSIIDGAVRPPATYLAAEEILRRQYLAHLVDDLARRPGHQQPRRATAAMAVGANSFLDALVRLAEDDPDALLDRFLKAFGVLDAGVVERLREWATPPAGHASSGLALQLHDTAAQWRRTVETLQRRQQAIREALPDLEQRAASPAAGEDDKRALRAAQASLRQTGGALAGLRGEYWIGVLEEYGLLPNYTLLDDAVTLDVALSWLDPETQTYDSEPMTHRRASASALHELAPGATFYAQGLEIEIDAVDLGTDGEAIREWVFCAECGYAREREHQTTGTCPRCGDGTLSDTRQRLKVVEMDRVSAQAHRDDARITDRFDERRRERFTVVPAADIDPDCIARRWHVEGGDFGATYLRRVTVRWLNLGTASGVGAQHGVAGRTQVANLFRLCTGCGVLDRTTRNNRPDEHRAWCRYRRDTAEHVETIALSRTLTTQGVVLSLPWSVSLGGELAVPSLTAAVLLGLRERFGGSPDHLGVELTVDPVLGGDNRTALLLHDTVPGGTGYLAEFSEPENVWTLLRAAWLVVARCPCRDVGRDGCHRCLLPFAPRGRPDVVSRATAERHLAELLSVTDGATEPGETMTWTCTEQAPPPSTAAESHLELHFRRAFIDLVKGLSGAVTELPGSNALPTLRITVPGTPMWLLEPQVQTGLGSVPDFVLRSVDTTVPAIAIFTDGYAYHASPAHNRLADDAHKRSVLRDAGYLVLSVTSDDLQTGVSPPSWWADSARQLLVSKAPGSVSMIDTITGGPLTFLRGWLQRPDPDAVRALADVVPLIFAVGAAPVAIGPDTDAVDVAVARLTDGAIDGTGGGQALIADRAPLCVAVRAVGAQLNAAAVLDDRATAVDHHDFRATWRDWLWFANAVQGATVAIAVTTVTAVREGSVPTVPAGATTLSGGWQPLWDAMSDETGRQLITALAEAGVELPDDVGEEIGDTGIPGDLVWSDRRLAVLLAPEPGDAKLIEDEGWQLVNAEADDVVAALATTGG